MKSKKGSTFLIVFFIALVMLIFYMVSMQGRVPSIGVQTVTHTETTFDAAEILKATVLQAAQEALTNATYIVAANLRNHRIIDDGMPNQFELSEVNQMISGRAKEIINQYLALIDGEQFGDIEYRQTAPIDSVEVLVTRIDVLEGSVFDNFGANFGGEGENIVYSTSTEDESTFLHEYQVSTQCDRFYYLINGLNEWGTTNLISQLSCNSIPAVVAKGSGYLYYPTIDEQTIHNIIAEAMLDLNNRFDQDVQCRYVLNNWVAESNPIPVGSDTQCPVGTGPTDLGGDGYCGGACPVGDPVFLTNYSDCEGQNSRIIYDGGDWSPTANSAYIYKGCGSVGIDHTLLIDLELSCTDYKCQNPVSSSGFEYLTINSSVYINLKHHRPPDPVACINPHVCGGAEEGGDTHEQDREHQDSYGTGTLPPGCC